MLKIAHHQLNYKHSTLYIKIFSDKYADVAELWQTPIKFILKVLCFVLAFLFLANTCNTSGKYILRTFK